MNHALLADLVVVAHLLFVIFAVAGGLLALRWRWLACAHLPAAVWAILVEFNGWICPLTPLENSLRQQAGEAIYRHGFVEQYLLPLLYPAALTQQTQFVLGGGVLAVNLVIYVFVWRAVRARQPEARSTASASSVSDEETWTR